MERPVPFSRDDKNAPNAFCSQFRGYFHAMVYRYGSGASERDIFIRISAPPQPPAPAVALKLTPLSAEPRRCDILRDGGASKSDRCERAGPCSFLSEWSFGWLSFSRCCRAAARNLSPRRAACRRLAARPAPGG